MVVLGIAAVIFVKRYIDDQGGSEDTYRVYALFDDAQGLVAQSRVVVAGIPIGSISSIRLSGGRARVDIDRKSVV